MLVAILVLATFAMAPVAKVAARVGLAGAIAILPAAVFGLLASQLPAVVDGRTILETHDWIPSLDVSLAFRVDGLSLLFALLITGIGTCVFLYASSYMPANADRPNFFFYLTLFMGAMLGAVLSENLVTMLVFWELTSVTSFMLIGFEHEKAQARKSALQGLLVTVGGGLALTAGVLLLGITAGTFQIGEIIDRAPDLADHPWSPAIILLFALGAFTKSAQTPFHFWLPNAMVAPTPVSAYLHSATMVKLGVYLLARLKPVFGEHELWAVLLPAAGLATMLTSALLLLRETDLKRILAYSTLTALGTLITMVGLPHEIAAVAMATFLIVHALYKACLFLVAGIIDHEAGTRNVVELGGLRQKMPRTAGVALLAALSMAGLPPFFGFIGKELIYEAGIASSWPWLVLTIAVLANAATVVGAALVAIKSFFGAALATPKAPHDPPWSMFTGPALLAILGLVIGLMPRLVEALVARVAEDMLGNDVHSHLALWHGFSVMLALSIMTLVLGWALYVAWPVVSGWLRHHSEIDLYGPNAIYDRALVALTYVAEWQTRLIQSGRLQRYLALTMLTLTVALLVAFYTYGIWVPSIPLTELNLQIALPLLLIIAAFAVVRARSFMAGIVAAGIVGFLMSLVYLFEGAPDLAFTQFSVEAVSIVVFLAIVGRMPFRKSDFRSTRQRWRDAVISIGFGAAAAIILLNVVTIPFDNRLSEYYADTSLVEAHGRNIVNVIIVDFRGIDTMGEITVLTLAAAAASGIISKVPFTKRQAMRAASNDRGAG